MFCSLEGMNCKNCYPRSTAESEIERAKKERERRGCEKPAKSPQYGDDETGEVFYRCPLSQVKEWGWFIIKVFNHYESGHLPFSGSVLEQSAKLMNMISLVRKYKMEYQEKKNKG